MAWILGALLILATLDTIPDPPGVNPSASQCKILQIDDCFCGAVVHTISFAPPHSAAVSFVAREVRKTHRPTHRIVHTGQAADPSPPAAYPSSLQSLQS